MCLMSKDPRGSPPWESWPRHTCISPVPMEVLTTEWCGHDPGMGVDPLAMRSTLCKNTIACDQFCFIDSENNLSAYE